MTNNPQQVRNYEAPIYETTPAQQPARPDNRSRQRQSRVPRCPLRCQHWQEVNGDGCPAGNTGFPEWMDLKTAQQYVVVSDRTLREWIHREHDPLPAVQDGGKLFISRSRLDRWMLSHPVTPECNREVGAIVEDVIKSLGEGQ